jgi:hypothetical protein
MGAALGAAVGALDAAFQCRHLWLADAPPGLHPAVWDVVALAAVAALERGRQRMCNVWDTRTPLPRARLVSIAAEVVPTGLLGSSCLVRVPGDCPARLAFRAPRPPVLVLCVGPYCDERAPGRGFAPRIARVVKGTSAPVSRARWLPWRGGAGVACPPVSLFVNR